MVAGEYAVLEPNQSLVVTAVNRFIFVNIKSSKSNKLSLTDFQLNEINWTYDYGKMRLDLEDKRTSFVQEAMEVTFTYLEEQSVPITPVHMTIKSELDDESGNKYGLGSSAAVVTGVVTALLTKYLHEEPSKDLIFKLSAIAHVKVQGSGSGADIAASTYGGMLEYKSFQANWLLNEIKQTNKVTQIIKKSWKYLHIKKLNFPKDWHMLVGWTGSPASTAKLVPQVLAYKDKNEENFTNFLGKSAKAVIAILSGIETKNIDRFYLGIKQNRQALAEIGQLADVPIETPLLYELQKIAEEEGGAGKLSGAGGGDCGIAFTDQQERIKKIKKKWEEYGIQNLEMTFYPDGVKKTLG